MQTYTLTHTQMQRVIQCLARAEVEKAFEGCVVPSIGKTTLAMLEKIVEDQKGE